MKASRKGEWEIAASRKQTLGHIYTFNISLNRRRGLEIGIDTLWSILAQVFA